MRMFKSCHTLQEIFTQQSDTHTGLRYRRIPLAHCSAPPEEARHALRSNTCSVTLSDLIHHKVTKLFNFSCLWILNYYIKYCIVLYRNDVRHTSYLPLFIDSDTTFPFKGLWWAFGSHEEQLSWGPSLCVCLQLPQRQRQDHNCHGHSNPHTVALQCERASTNGIADFVNKKKKLLFHVLNWSHHNCQRLWHRGFLTQWRKRLWASLMLNTLKESLRYRNPAPRSSSVSILHESYEMHQTC